MSKNIPHNFSLNFSVLYSRFLKNQHSIKMFNYKNHSYEIYSLNLKDDKINFIHRKENVKIDDYLKDFMEKNWEKAISINPR
ncbi:MAG: hypothetical protein K2O64_02300, partial [Lactobacillus sp.]|nr:hypothetical protein [Lactobacillus sp.]